MQITTPDALSIGGAFAFHRGADRRERAGLSAGAVLRSEFGRVPVAGPVRGGAGSAHELERVQLG